MVVVPSVFCPSCQSWYSCSLGLLSSGLLWLDRHAVKKNGEGCKITALHSSDHRFDLGSSSYLCDLHCLIAVKIPHLGCFVTGSSEDFTPILVKEQHIINYSVAQQITGLKWLCIKRPTSLQHASSTGPVCICWALGTVCPLSCTSQHRTWGQMIKHSQTQYVLQK